MEQELVVFARTEIINHLQAHPSSADTAEAVHQAWIPWPDSPAPVAVTRAALEQLEADGLLERVQAGSREVWRRTGE